MRNKLLFISLFLLASLASCKETKWLDIPTGNPPAGAITGQPGEPEEPEDPTDGVIINSSYIRGDFFELGRISTKSMAACNDLIFLAASPYANGDVVFGLPANDGTLSGGATYEASYNGRNGVLKLDGTGTMNTGEGIWNSPDGAPKAITFCTHIYIDEWVPGAFVFKKQKDKEIVAFMQLGETEGTINVRLGDNIYNGFKSEKLTVGGWHYLAMEYNGSSLRVMVDDKYGEQNDIQVTLPNIRANFSIGEKLKGRMDETSVWNIATISSGKNPIEFTSWNPVAKVLAYWKYDESAKVGKDSHTWLMRWEKIRKSLEGETGMRNVRLGVSGGEWVEMIANPGARRAFASNVKVLIDKYNFDGLDLDFEWPDNATKYQNYSDAIVDIREVLGNNILFTVSLHPVSFKITKAAITAVNFISYQCYGPAVMRYPYEQFLIDAKAALDYGIPKDKLVMGVPFMGSTGQVGEQAGYSDFVNAGLTDKTLDKFTYKGKEYIFNGQETIRKKTKYVCDNGLRGIMSWDLAIDVPIEEDMSLLKVVKEEFDNFANTPKE